MATGGLFGAHKIRHFNGHLFEDATVFDLNDDERRILAEASEADWQYVEPSIMGTLFARGLDPDQSAALGAQFTGRDDIVTIVEPVLMAPLRREWAVLKASLLPASKKGKAKPGDRARLEAFLKKLRKLVVMDPACGSGNFLYVSLQMLLDLEKEVITFATHARFPVHAGSRRPPAPRLRDQPLRLRAGPGDRPDRLPAMAARQRLRQRPHARPAKPRRLPERRRAAGSALPQQGPDLEGSPGRRAQSQTPR